MTSEQGRNRVEQVHRSCRRWAGGKSTPRCSRLRLFAGPAFQRCCRLCSSGVSLPSPLVFSFLAASEHLQEPGCSQECEAGQAIPRPVASRGRGPSYGLCEVGCFLAEATMESMGQWVSSLLPSVSLTVIVPCSSLSPQWSPVYHSHHPVPDQKQVLHSPGHFYKLFLPLN